MHLKSGQITYQLKIYNPPTLTIDYSPLNYSDYEKIHQLLFINTPPPIYVFSKKSLPLPFPLQLPYWE